MSRDRLSRRVRAVPPSGIRRFFDIAATMPDVISLGVGEPDFITPADIRAAGKRSIDQTTAYTSNSGLLELRVALAAHLNRLYGADYDPEAELLMAVGVSEAMMAAALATLDPGDEVLVPEPAHDNYRPACHLADAEPVAVLLGPGDRLDVERLAAAVTPRTRAILLNTPHNPTGRVFDRGELEALAELCVRHDLLLLTDEIYDRLVFDGHAHLSPGALDALADRTITVSGLGKTFAVTGWRLGYVIAPDRYAAAVHTVHDFLTICAPTPLQAAACAALDLPPEYYRGLVAEYAERRALMLHVLSAAGFVADPPEGAYYMLGNFRNLPVPQAQLDPTAFARWMTVEVGVAVVPGDAAYSLEGCGLDVVRFAFCKRLETLEAAGERLAVALRS
jgi:aminotransferase